MVFSSSLANNTSTLMDITLDFSSGTVLIFMTEYLMDNWSQQCHSDFSSPQRGTTGGLMGL